MSQFHPGLSLLPRPMSSLPRSHSLDFGPVSDITGNVTNPPVWSPAPGVTPGHKGQLHSCPVPAHRQHHNRVPTALSVLHFGFTTRMQCQFPNLALLPLAGLSPAAGRRHLTCGCHPSSTHTRRYFVWPSPAVWSYTHSHPQACTQPQGAPSLPPATPGSRQKKIVQ